MNHRTLPLLNEVLFNTKSIVVISKICQLSYLDFSYIIQRLKWLSQHEQNDMMMIIIIVIIMMLIIIIHGWYKFGWRSSELCWDRFKMRRNRSLKMSTSCNTRRPGLGVEGRSTKNGVFCCTLPIPSAHTMILRLSELFVLVLMVDFVTCISVLPPLG